MPLAIAIVFVKVALIGVISWNLIPLPIVLSDSKIDKKGTLNFPSCRYKSQLIKRVPFFIFRKQM